MMTHERKHELEQYMGSLMTAKISDLVDLQMKGRITHSQLTHELSMLAEIAACIATAYSALHLNTEDLLTELRASLAGNKMLPAVKS